MQGLSGEAGGRFLKTIHRMVYEDCEGEESNPIVNGHFNLAPPPSVSPSKQ